MTKDPSKRRMVENEAFFRTLNEKVQKGIDETNTMAREDGQEPIDIDGDMPLYFLCECADENCIKRIKISPNAYNKIHKDPKAFTIAPDHEVDYIEDIIKKDKAYSVVVKHDMPPQKADTLNSTPVDNAN